MFFTSKEAAEITGCSLRQLQYWREKGVVVPTITATGKGRSVYYSQDDLASLAVMAYLLDAGLDFQVALGMLQRLREEEPEFFKPSVVKRFMLSRNSGEESFALREFNWEEAMASLKAGQPVIPVWLDEIHQRLARKLAV